MDDLELIDHPIIQPEIIFSGEDAIDAPDDFNNAGDDFSGDSIKIVRQTEDIAKSTASMEIITNIVAAATESSNVGNQAIIDVAGQKYSVNGTENLQRGDDEEDDRKMSRKSSNTIEYYTSTTDSSSSYNNEFTMSEQSSFGSSTEYPSSTTSEYEAFLSSSSSPSTTDEVDGSSSSTADPCAIYLEKSFGRAAASSTTTRQLSDEEIIAIYESGTTRGPDVSAAEKSRQWTDDELIAMYESGTTSGPPANDDDYEMKLIRQYELCMKVSSMMSSSEPNPYASSTLGPDESIAARMIAYGTNSPTIIGRSPGEPLLIPEWERTNSSSAAAVSSTILHPVSGGIAAASSNDIKEPTPEPKDDPPAYGDDASGEEFDSKLVVTAGPPESSKNGFESFWELQGKANDIQMGQFTNFVKTFFIDPIELSTSGPTE